MFRAYQTATFANALSSNIGGRDDIQPALTRCELATTSEASTLRRRRRRKHVAMLELNVGVGA